MLIVILPKAEAIWAAGGPHAAEHSWLVGASATILTSLYWYGPHLLIAVTATMIVVDSHVTNWTRFRNLPFIVIAFSTNFAVLVALVILCIGFAVVTPAFVAAASENDCLGMVSSFLEILS
ncbi:MAG: hypothetical protein AAF585_19500 [Verrucomicrobiota bacterium]